MTGKLVVVAILLFALIGGAAMYYLQVYAYYFDVEAQPGNDVLLMDRETSTPKPIAYSEFQAIDATSSPIRYRACFKTTMTPDIAATQFVESKNASPRVAPSWFDCFDAQRIGAEMDQGSARAFVSQKNIAFGVDRVVVITDAGHGYAWHELNNCGEKAYDGTIVGEECPPVPERN